MEYKYTLIISQYYHSRHFFIVHQTEDFLIKAKEFSLELMKHKRDESDNKKLDCGDIDYQFERGLDGVRQRYNINDAGDIYFIQGNFTNYLAGISRDYQKDSIRESKGYIKKAITDDISKHHSYSDVAEIVEKYFELA
jgi:hypothetical protein